MRLVALGLTAASCTYRLPEVPAAEDGGGADAPTLPASCEAIERPDSPSCPAGAGHCDRVRLTLPASAWRVGPNDAFEPTSTDSFEASGGGRAIEVDVFEVDVARYRRFVASTAFSTSFEVRYPDGSSLSARAAPAEPNDPGDRGLCTYADAPAADRLPLNCVSWASALAFCAFDGGRLPTLAELEYVRRWWPVAGLDEPGPNGRRYPWGDADPRVRFGTPLPARCAGGTAVEDALPSAEGPLVGCLDGLAGGVTEWLADAPGESLADLCFADGFCEGPGDRRLVATGAWRDLDVLWMRSSTFAARFSSESNPSRGVRCVYDVE